MTVPAGRTVVLPFRSCGEPAGPVLRPAPAPGHTRLVEPGRFARLLPPAAPGTGPAEHRPTLP
jgi:hypothetical protein